MLCRKKETGNLLEKKNVVARSHVIKKCTNRDNAEIADFGSVVLGEQKL